MNLDMEEPGRWEVHKFGGTSVADAACFHNVACIVEHELSRTPKHATHIALVVSAMGAKKPGIKTTDLLLNCVSYAAVRNHVDLQATLQQIESKHVTCLAELGLPREEQARLQNIIQQDLRDISDILKTVALMKWNASRISELVSGYGELWSTQILAALLQFRQQQQQQQEAHVQHYFAYIDARNLITVQEEPSQDFSLAWDISQAKLHDIMQQQLQSLSASENNSPILHFVMTGYVAVNTDGVPTTLQRDGSDYSASILGRLLKASSITIWTDVDGVLSADPRRVPQAHVLPEVSYNEAMELAYFGAKVIHPKTMVPAIEADPKIPIYIRNTFNPSFRGTRIYTSSTTHTERDQCVCGFSTIENVALINVEGCGMIGVQGVAQRLFATLQSIGVNVILISQASSEHSISFACEERQAAAAKDAILDTFAKELTLHHISDVGITSPCSIIAAVGDGMSSTTGVAGLFFSALGDAHINVLAIAQGCSERNISAVIHTQESTRALRAVHAAFRLSHTAVRVAIVGIDEEIGQSLLKLMESQRSKLIQTFDIDFQVCAVVTGVDPDRGREKLIVLHTDRSVGTDSITTTVYDSYLRHSVSKSTTSTTTAVEDSLSKVTITESEDTSYAPTDQPWTFGTVVEGGLTSLLDHLISKDCAHTVVFDCTADQHIANEHPKWLEAGVHVVTANSKGLSGPRTLRDAIDRAETSHGKLSANYLREVTAAGALPVISTLRDLLSSGDHIRRMDGILSVSMSYILHRVAPPPGVVACELYDQGSSGGAFRRSFSKFPSELNDDGDSYTHPGCAFSVAVKEAIALGLMEKDPLKDLSNEYVARILMVLAKELGIAQSYDIEQIQMASDMLMVSVERLPDQDGHTSLRKLSMDGIEEYDKLSHELDVQMSQRVASAAAKGCVPRHIASIDVATGEMNVRIVDVPCHHIFATTPPSCAVVRFFTHRHKRYPLVVQGPAEGADSTASALLAELLHLMRSKIGPKSGALSRTQTSAFLDQLR